MKYHNERRAALLTAILALTVLLYSLILPASASALTAAREDHNHPRLHKPLAFEMEDGKVTDSDGIIGNSLHGADAAHRHASTPMQGMKDAAGRMAQGAKNTVGEAARGAKNAADTVVDGVENAADRMIGGAENGNARADSATGRASESNAGNQSGSMTNQDNGNVGSVIGWIVTVLIVLGIVLIVLTMLPKKNRNRR